MSRHGHHANAFTLIELVVAIAVIAIMVGLLLPVLGSMRQAGITSVCQSNLHQISIATQGYTVDSQGVIPFGPASYGVSAPDDFYIVDGQITNQITTETGQPMAAGLMLANHLSKVPETLFCPGTDDQLEAKQELEKVGTTTALSSYSYRHGSNTYAQLTSPPDELDNHIRIDNLGLNRNNDPIRALFVDNNFTLNRGTYYYSLFHRTNHQTQHVNIAYADGHVENRNNYDGKYTANVGGFLYGGLHRMLVVLENADLN